MDTGKTTADAMGSVQRGLREFSFWYLISPHNITDWSNIQVMRMNEMITKDEMAWYLNKFFR